MILHRKGFNIVVYKSHRHRPALLENHFNFLLFTTLKAFPPV